MYSAHSKGVQCLYIYKQPLSSPKLITGSFDSSIIVFDVEVKYSSNSNCLVQECLVEWIFKNVDSCKIAIDHLYFRLLNKRSD